MDEEGKEADCPEVFCYDVDGDEIDCPDAEPVPIVIPVIEGIIGCNLLDEAYYQECDKVPRHLAAYYGFDLLDLDACVAALDEQMMPGIGCI